MQIRLLQWFLSTCEQLVLHNGLTVLMHLIRLNCVFYTCVSSGGQHGNVQPFSDEDASIETLSHCSSYSDTASVAEEGRFVYLCTLCVLCLILLVSMYDFVCVCMSHHLLYTQEKQILGKCLH